MSEGREARPGFTDLCAWTGHWAGLPPEAGQGDVLGALEGEGVARVCLSPLDGLWALNPHLANGALYRLAGECRQVYPVPLLDPGVPTWREELEQIAPELEMSQASEEEGQ